MKATRLILTALLMLALVPSVMAQYAGKRILHIDSYHKGYAWSDGMERGIEAVLNGTGVDYRVHFMDTKRNGSEDFKAKAAEAAKAEIEQFKPDVVIATDDNAAKYVIVPFYKGGNQPFVFAGLNWDASLYGFPTSNVTGMVEVSPVPQLLEQLRPFAKGERVGHLAADTTSAHKEGEFIAKIFGLELVEYYATDMADWKQGFKEIQGKVDMLIVGNSAGIPDWNDDAAAAFAEAETQVPTGATQEFMSRFAMITFAKVAAEQGEWAAQSALKVLDGTKPGDIPVVQNERGVLIINARIATGLQADVPFDLIASASHVIE